ncbi:chorismate mutase [Maritimibacter alkaliphilus]|uniref:chorismate mutase n=1 Tax=Maritimibacter alkaliphilus TaxID=404236 RepID=UPI0021BD58E2|nr:chorismate mutase [Maritimibacter alkaliphilus]
MRLTRKTPAEVETMPELRAQIDHLDRELIALLAERQRHIDRAAQLKPALGWPARIDERVEEVVAKVEATAEELGFDPALAGALWRQMIDEAIAREERLMAGRR